MILYSHSEQLTDSHHANVHPMFGGIDGNGFMYKYTSIPYNMRISVHASLTLSTAQHPHYKLSKALVSTGIHYGITPRVYLTKVATKES